jgi:hypothetical protein
MNKTMKPESALQKEWRLFKEGFVRLVNAYLNMMFDLSPQAARGRFWSFVILFFASGFLLSLINHPLIMWLTRVQDIFLYFFNSAYRASYTAGNPVSNLRLFAQEVFSDPRNLRFLPVLLAPYLISLQFAAIYLADIFNLEDVSIARRHITEVALRGSDETIRISKGEIAKESERSPNVLIGGPGKVIVDLDSAVLFEKPDGTPHVIGPTNREPGGKATIEGFERFREAIDLRDHFIELRDLGENSQSVSSRSRDGIPITATDVRFLFSADREGKTPSSDLPYPFSEQAVKDIIYKHTSKVMLDQDTPSKYDFRWIDSMVSLIRRELGKFMNQRNLTEYLASFGIPEVDSAQQREDKYVDEARRVLPLGEDPPEKQNIPPVPKFVPRPEITNLFSKFADAFTKNARERGVQLQWIGVGTWKSPVESVFNKHIEAWKISRENTGMRGDDALKKFSNETALDRLMELIREIPLGSYQQARSGMTNYAAVLRTLLVDYRTQLTQAKNLWISKGDFVPMDVEEAIKIIFEVLGHPVGKGASPEDGFDTVPDDSRTQKGDNTSGMPGFAYADLVRITVGDEAAANRLIEDERQQFPNDSQEALIARAIDRLLKTGNNFSNQYG